MDNIYKAVQLTIDSQNLALSKTPTHVYIANQYVDTNDTPLITAPFIIQKALENGTGVVDIVSSTIGSIYEVRLLCDAEVLISGYFYMPPMNVNFSELELYTSYPPRTPPVVNEFWQKTENFILEKTNTLLNFVQVFNSLSSMRLSLGYLEELLTTKKSNLVSAINEVYDNTKGVVSLYDKNVVAGAGANGWASTLVTDASGKNQQQINNTLDFKNRPEFHGGTGDGVTIDNAAFISLLATNPNSIVLNPSATYLLDSATTPTVTDSCVINGNGATIIMDQRWNLQKQAMWGTFLSADVTKGAKVLPVLFTNQFQVGQKVLIFQNKGLSGADIDPYFLSVSNDVDNGEYSSHINYISAVDHTNKTITLAIPLLYNAPQQTTVNILTDKKLTFVNTNFVFRGDATGFRIFDNCDNIEFIGGSIKQDASQNNSVSLRVNTCHNVNFTDVDLHNVSISIEYGSFNCGVKHSRGVSKGNGDAILMIWCAATRCFSEHNDYRASNDMKPGSISAGVYIGAKTRDCWSTDDNVYGMPYGFRAQWGAVNAVFKNPKYKNPNGIYSIFMDYSHNPQVYGGTLEHKPMRTVGVYDLTMRDTVLDSGWRGEAGEVPLMLDLNRGTDTATVRENYTINGITVIGAARSWVALSKSSFSGNNMTSFRFVNAGVMKDTYFTGNNFGNFYAQNMVNCGLTGNTIDHNMLRAGTIAGADVAAVHLYAQTAVHMAGNTITHPTCGVKRTSPTSQLNCITDGGGNNIIAPTQWDTGVNDSTAPTVGGDSALLSQGLEYKSNVAGSKVVWRYNGSSWIKRFSEYPQLTYSQGSFPNTPNGLTTFGTTRNISGAVVGDTVLVSTTSTDIGEVNGKYFARVTSADTVTVYYQDKTGVAATVPSLNITLTLVK